MNIQPIQIYNPYYNIKQNSLKVGQNLHLKNLSCDTVSFGIRHKKKNKALSPEEKLLREHEKARLKKAFVNNSLRKAITQKTISDKKLKVIIGKISEYPEIIEELFFEPAGGGLMLNVSDDILKSVLQNTSNYRKLIFTKDLNGETFIEKAPSSKIIIFNEEAKKFPEILTRLYMQKDKKGRVPAHYLPPEALKSMNECLKKYPKLLHKIYTTQDKHGNTPAHNRFYASYKIILPLINNMPETTSQINKLENEYGEKFNEAITKAQKYKGPYKSTWNYILNNC